MNAMSLSRCVSSALRTRQALNKVVLPLVATASDVTKVHDIVEGCE